MEKIGIIGAGSWGTALAWHLSENGCFVTMWSSFEDEIEMLTKNRGNEKKLPGVKLGENVSFTSDMEEAIHDKKIVITAVPSFFPLTFPFDETDATVLSLLTHFTFLLPAFFTVSF